MIIDSLMNAGNYTALHPRFKEAFEFIKSQNLETIEVGKYPINGPELHAAVSLKDGVAAADAKFESHELFMDIQVCPLGAETIGWKPKEKCTQPKDAYNPEKDVTFYNDTPDTYFTLKAGQFAIFFPNDVHAPMIGEGPVKKLVVKVKI